MFIEGKDSFSSVPYHFLPINGELEFSFREQWKRYSNVRMEEKYNDRITRDKRRVVIVLIGRGEARIKIWIIEKLERPIVTK